ncbi:MAG: riboflavin synthase [Sphingomonas sp.]|uniref:riboflavin synthase n=1 Tax=Sphingomonas sp. TaxID=28214 RepID=UPI001832E38E|nr:riboflavin synthase [Sphingomonas sp.]MBA3667099.1 riboflavin synthase [Sphingomonas sp.]
MFTGIITDIGTVRSAEQRGDLRLVIGSAYDMATVDLGASIACSGACLTVVDKGADWFAVDLSSESIARTAPGLWAPGSRLNLERALRVGDELGGHIVTGHVDTVATVASAIEVGGSWALAIDAPRAFGGAIAPKGSITLDGVSLTVNTVEDKHDVTRFTVNIIPHTADHTTLGVLTAGRGLNLEIDVLARYLQRMADARM